MCVYILLCKQICLYLHYKSKHIAYNGKDKQKPLKSKSYGSIKKRKFG